MESSTTREDKAVRRAQGIIAANVSLEINSLWRHDRRCKSLWAKKPQQVLIPRPCRVTLRAGGQIVRCLDHGAKVVVVAVAQWEDQRAVVLAIIWHLPTCLVLDLVQQHTGLTYPLPECSAKGLTVEVSQA